MLDLLSGESTELTELEMVRKLPLPFPPEPAAWLGIRLTTQALIKADENQGRRGRLLKVLDAVGMGFDSCAHVGARRTLRPAPFSAHPCRPSPPAARLPCPPCSPARPA